jgi:beta-1,4-mannosyltransferase
MAKVLEKQAGVKAIPLHDRPPKHFQPLKKLERSSFLKGFGPTSKATGNWRLLVSSTSWTPDEDFSILLNALVSYSDAVKQNASLPKIITVITGKGPQKEHYLAKIEQLKRENKLLATEIHTAWLSSEDYATLLGAADLGVSLHMSSSGLDLPMKVADMFGTGLPVVGWSFEAWPELVKEGINGYGFESSEHLTELLVELLGNDGNKLSMLRQGALQECNWRWDDEWDKVGGQTFHLA